MRIADDRLALRRSRSIFCNSVDSLVFSKSPISRKPSQNSFSSDTLVLCPFRTIERLTMADFMVAPSFACMERQRCAPPNLVRKINASAVYKFERDQKLGAKMSRRAVMANAVMANKGLPLV